MSRCNYCQLKDIRSQANSDGHKVVLRASSFMGGTNVYVLPPGVKMPNRIQEPSDELPNGDEFHEKYQEAWFMEISKECCC